MKNCEYVLFLRKGKAKWINDIGGSKTVHQFDNIIGNKTHPCEKPVEVCFIAFIESVFITLFSSNNFFTRKV